MKIYLIAFLLLISAFASAQSSQKEVLDFLSEINIPVTTNNKLKLLKNGKEKFDDLFESIKQAKHHIHLEYFNFRNDSIAGLLFDLLAVKAKQGVKVRALFDAFGNWSNNKPLKKKHLEQIKNNGIEIVKFDPIRFPYLNHIFHRDHRKIVVIDGKIGYTGGINIADYYVVGLPEIGDWRDTHIRIEGDAVNFLQEIFLTIWNQTTNQSVWGDEYFYKHPHAEGKAVAVVDRAPRKMPKQLRHTYVKSINAAQKKIQIVNPYFLPPHSVKKALKKAVERGVEVEIMISAESDIKFTPDGVFYAAHKLMKRGAEIYVYEGGFHHSKIMMVDDAFCTVGSANLDSRSMRFDYEVNVFIFDEEVTQELIGVFEHDKNNSEAMTPEIWKKRPKWKRFVGWCANALTPFL